MGCDYFDVFNSCFNIHIRISEERLESGNLCSSMFFTMDANDNTFYAANRYTGVSFVRLYIGGFFGSIFMILISKFIGRLPIVSYIGRYSIVVLITHQFYLFVIRNVLYQINIPQDSAWVSLGVFLIVVLISLPTIKYGIKYLPYCFAQKELLH